MVAKPRLPALVLLLFFCNLSTVFAAQVLFTPSIVAREEYTDNLFLDRNNTEDDYISVAGLDLMAEVLWRTAGLELNYIPTYNSFNDHDALNYWRHEASLYTWKELQRNTKVEFRDTYLRTDDPVDQSATIEQEGQPPQSVIGVDTTRRGRNGYYTNTAFAQLSHQFGPEDRLYLSAQHYILRDVDPPPGAPLDDNDITTGSMGVAYNFTRRLGLNFDTSYESSDYADRNDRTQFDGNIRLLNNVDRALSIFLNYHHTILTFDKETDESYNIYEPGLGFRYNFPDNMYIELSVAYYIQDFKYSDDEDGFNLNSDIYKRWIHKSGYFSLRVISGYQIQDYGSRDNGLDQFADGRLETGYNFSAQLTGTVFGQYRYDKYPNRTPEVEQHSLGGGATVNWQATQWMILGLSYRYSRITSDIPTDEYAENRVMLTARISPATPYRWN